MSEATPTAEQLARRKLFTAALRSGRFPQGEGYLSSVISGTWVHCCLGVACLVAIENGLDVPFRETEVLRLYLTNSDSDELDSSSVLPETVAKWYGWDSPDPLIPVVIYPNREPIEILAIDANDTHHKTFPEIADAFEAKYIRPFEQPEGTSGRTSE